MALKRTTPPAAEPITLAQAKLHLRVDHADEDALIEGLITTVRMACEDRIQGTLITTGWTFALDAFPGGPGACILLPMPPTIGLASVQYVDPAGATQAMDWASLVHVDLISQPARIAPRSGSWPATARQLNAVQITYTAGHGPAAADVPRPLVQWMLLAMGDLYANRQRSAERPQVPQGFADGLLDPYRLYAL